MPERLHYSRRVLIRSLLLAAGLTPGLLQVVRSAQAMSRDPIVPGVQDFTGDFRLNGVPARRGDLVKPGDVATTGPNSSAIIIIGRHAFMLRANSRVEFFPTYFENEGTVSGVLKVVTGAMLSVFGQTSGTTIATPHANLGIRGTGCYVASSPDRTYACLCYGSANLISAPTGRLLEKLTTTHHEAPRYIYPPGAGKLITSAPVIDHSDAELRLLESIVHRTPPFDDNIYSDGGTYDDRY